MTEQELQKIQVAEEKVKQEEREKIKGGLACLGLTLSFTVMFLVMCFAWTYSARIGLAVLIVWIGLIALKTIRMGRKMNDEDKEKKQCLQKKTL